MATETGPYFTSICHKPAALALLAVAIIGCSGPPDAQKLAPSERLEPGPLFERITSQQSGVTFRNVVEEDISSPINIFSYQYFYNGGGVAITDLDGDQFPDLVLTGNTAPNKIYRNKGNLEFEDVTEQSGLALPDHWCTGATFADVNADGLPDLYICVSGPSREPDALRNKLFINQGNFRFEEQAAQYGLDDPNPSTQASFLDYDKDGDLDLFVINHARTYNLTLEQESQIIRSREQVEAVTNNLYRNEGNGRFTRVTEEAGLLRFGYGLGLCVADMNRDGWPDIYVANDFSIPDFLYINNGNGTFSDNIKQLTRNIAYYGMGCDVADFNNDGLVDIGVVDMAPDDHVRSKTLMASMDETSFWTYVEQFGYQYQYMFNALQVGHSNGTFSNIANLAGVAKTDWSWTALFADLDNDGFKDYLVTNGYRRYGLDNDFQTSWRQLGNKPRGTLTLAEKQALYETIPSEQLPNLIFRNNRNYTFSDVAADWGLTDSTFSNGAAVADLDRDGDLDLVISNIDEEAFIYRNRSREMSDQHFLRLRLLDVNNVPAAHAKATLHFADGSLQFQECGPVRGYQSSQEEVLHFGLGAAKQVERIEVVWANGQRTEMLAVDSDQELTVRQEAALSSTPSAITETPLLLTVQPNQLGLTFKHVENPFNDFEKEVLLPHRQSVLGPMAAVGDANGDGLDDLYMGGAAQQSGALYLQQPNGQFVIGPSQPWTEDFQSEDMGALFFDADNDGDQDLVVVSGGGGEFSPDAPELQDRFYRNTGGGQFERDPQALPTSLVSGSKVVSADLNQDGFADLVIAGRQVPGKYPFPARSAILMGDGKRFQDVTSQWSEALLEGGLITDLLITDLNADNLPDVVAVGEWMSPLFLENTGSALVNKSSTYLPESRNGWWYSVAAHDLDQDGDLDLVFGNIGLNSKFHPSPEKPLRLYCEDFDETGTYDIVLSTTYKGREVPIRGKECSTQQMPFVSTRFPTYKGFATASLSDILGEEKMSAALTLEATHFASAVCWNEGEKGFSWQELPMEAQFAPVNAIQVRDINHDGQNDLILVGNMFHTEVETPRYDGGTGTVLLGNKDKSWETLSIQASGLFAPMDAKDMVEIKLQQFPVKALLVANNSGPLQLFVPAQ